MTTSNVISFFRREFRIIDSIPAMRYSAGWMTIADERILERLSEVETDTPKGMADSGDVRFSRQYIGERCRKLTNYGMLQHLGNGVYRITETGEQYLDGEIDAKELEPGKDQGIQD